MENLMLQAGFICLSLNWTASAVAIALQSDAFYDAVGSASTILTMLAAFLHLGRSEQCSLSARTSKGHSCIVSVLSMALVLLWTVRLGMFLVYRIYLMGHDSRMDKIKTNPAYFFVAWSFQGVWVFSITLPVTLLVSKVASEGAGPINRPLMALGMTIWVMGMMIAVPADWQKLQFRLKPENKGKFINEGLFKYARYPMYFGEILTWTGIAVLCTSALRSWVTIAMAFWSPVFTYCLLVYVSGVPIQERQAAKRWGTSQAYTEYKKKTYVLLPWPKLKAHSA